MLSYQRKTSLQVTIDRKISKIASIWLAENMPVYEKEYKIKRAMTSFDAWLEAQEPHVQSFIRNEKKYKTLCALLFKVDQDLTN